MLNLKTTQIKKRNPFRIAALFFLLIFFSCQKENLNEETATEIQNVLKLNVKAFTEHTKLPLLTEKVLKITPKTLKTTGKRGEYDDLYNFTIDSSKVAEVQYENSYWYTMRVDREGLPIGVTENLVVVQKDGVEPKAYLYKYLPDDAYFEALEYGDTPVFSGEIKHIPLDYDEIFTETAFVICTTTTSYVCGNSESGAPAGEGCSNNADGGAHVITVSITTCATYTDYITSKLDFGDVGGGGGINPDGRVDEQNNNFGSDIVTTPLLLDLTPHIALIHKLGYSYSSPEANYLRRYPDFEDEIKKFIDEDNNSTNSKSAARMTIETYAKGLHYSDLSSEFTNIVNKYNSFNITTTNGYEVNIWYIMKCAELQVQHPEWSEWRVVYEASKEIIHLGLDVIGLVPGVGEIADLVNGAIYYAEGDNLNGTLSMSAAIPFAGWASTGAKWAIKCTRLANGTKIALSYTKRVNGLFDFGRKNSASFRSQLSLAKGDGLIGHHVIPWKWNNEDLVQAAANFKWHPHDALINGKTVTSVRHSGSHNNYDNFVKNEMNKIIQQNPGILNNPELAYNKLKGLSDWLQNIIDSNQTKKINELF